MGAGLGLKVGAGLVQHIITPSHMMKLIIRLSLSQLQGSGLVCRLRLRFSVRLGLGVRSGLGLAVFHSPYVGWQEHLMTSQRAWCREGTGVAMGWG